MNKLLKHFEAMQSACAAYVSPEPYAPISGAFAGKALSMSEQTRDRAFALDMIYMLDGPEQREAQAAAAEDIAGLEQAAEWRMDIRKQVEQADAANKLSREHAREMERRNAELQRSLDHERANNVDAMREVSRLRGQLDMLERLGTIPKVPQVPVEQWR